MSEITEQATKDFAEWINAGPALAKAAGCHVGIKVTTAKNGKIHLSSSTPKLSPECPA